MNKKIQPAVFGATGYSGFELVRLLAHHPGAKKPLLFHNGEGGGVAVDERIGERQNQQQ